MKHQIGVFVLLLTILVGSSNALAQDFVTDCQFEDDGDLCTDGVFEGLCVVMSYNNCIEDENGDIVVCDYPDCRPKYCRQDQKPGDPCKLGDLDGVCEHRCSRVECNHQPSGSGWCLLPAALEDDRSNLSDDGCSATGSEPVGPLHIPFLLGILGLRRYLRSRTIRPKGS